MLYLIVLIVLLILELFYFKLADKFDIIDKPNERSSHSQITLRGGGIVFYFGVLLFFFLSDFAYPWFFLGLTLMATISFLDDIYSLSNRIRLIIHFISVLMMAFELDVFSFPLHYILLSFVLIVGVINAYNFMDGINGITACYSIAVGGLLIIVNDDIEFINPNLLNFSLLGVLVFTYFNFRASAKTFAGDVGSVSIAYILSFALGALIIKSGNFVYILFLAVYGVDTVWTIVSRLINRENIFEAHRSHLYQYLGNEAGYNKLAISFSYGLIQFFIGLAVVLVSERSGFIQIVFSVSLLVVLSILYLLVRRTVIRSYVNN